MGETVVISRPRNENIYMISEAEYNALQKAKKNAEYLAKIDESIENHKKGDTISFTMEELQAMESEDWKPTQKVLEFERTHNIQRR
jgi:antitoxin YefM